MKTFRLFFTGLFFILPFSILVTAQTEKTRSNIALIDAKAFFDEKTGIRDFIEARKLISEEYKSQYGDHEILIKKYIDLQNEVLKFKNSFEPPSRLIDELNKIECEIKQKQAVVKSLADERWAEITGDGKKRLATALKQFARERGYLVILDKSELNISSFIVEDAGKYSDVTGEFIEFYNSTFNCSKSK